MVTSADVMAGHGVRGWVFATRHESLFSHLLEILARFHKWFAVAQFGHLNTVR